MVEDLLVYADERHAGFDQTPGRQQARPRQALPVSLADLGRFAGQVEGRARPARSHHGERTSHGVVHRRHDGGRLRPRRERVQLIEQRAAPADAQGRQVVERLRPRQGRLADRQDRVVVLDLRLALEGRFAMREERIVPLPEEPAIGSPAPPPLLTGTREARHADGAGEVAGAEAEILADRADVGRVGRRGLIQGPVVGVSGQERQRVVRVERVAERTDQRRPVHPACQPWQVLADVEAGQRRGDRPELAPDAVGGIGLEVEHIDVRRAAEQVEHEDRSGRPARARGGPARGLHPARKRQPAEEGERPDPHQFPTRDPVAQHPRPPHHSKHRTTPAPRARRPIPIRIEPAARHISPRARRSTSFDRPQTFVKPFSNNPAPLCAGEASEGERRIAASPPRRGIIEPMIPRPPSP